MREKDGLKRAAGRKGEEGVALIIVLGFLGLMLMMAVAFMTQARVERLVSDSSTEAMRARQIAQTGIAAGIQDYVHALHELDSQSEDEHDIFLSGDSSANSYTPAGASKNESYGTTNLWRGKVKNWVWDWHREGEGDDSVKNMKWIWVVEEPGKSSRILGRYAYACFDMGGAVDANLLGQVVKQTMPTNGYGMQTDRNNVRKMLLDAVREDPEKATDMQLRLAEYQDMWKGFDTPPALLKLTDGKGNDGDPGGENRWSKIGNDEASVGGQIPTDYLSCYSYAALHKENGGDERKEFKAGQGDIDELMRSAFVKEVVAANGISSGKSDLEKALRDYTSPKNDPPSGTDYPSVKAVPMFNEVYAKLELLHAGGNPKLKLTLKVEFWYPFESRDNAGGTYRFQPDVKMSGNKVDADFAIPYRATLEDGTYVMDTLTVANPPMQTVRSDWNDGQPMNVKDEDALVYEFAFPSTVNQGVKQVQVRPIQITKGMKLMNENGIAVDAMPDDLGLKFTWSSTILTPNENTVTANIEVVDPRLNHLGAMWQPANQHSLGEKNEATKTGQAQAEKKLGYKPAPSFYCRNGKMQTPAEFGYLPLWDGKTPWMTLDIFGDKVLDEMNLLVCPAEADWSLVGDKDVKVYYTNGTINPYTREQAVLNGAFYGLDLRVPGCQGDPDDNEVMGAGRTKELTDELIKTKTPENDAFKKDGAAGWARVLRYKGFSLNKNQRVALLHNTWGLFNESDKLFVIVVVAQSISEAPEKVDGVGHWDKDEDMITGERWAVALCWTDMSEFRDAKNPPETDIIMFQYLNE